MWTRELIRATKRCESIAISRSSMLVQGGWKNASGKDVSDIHSELLSGEQVRATSRACAGRQVNEGVVTTAAGAG